MSEMFDVDCPRTPDEDNKDGAPTSAAKKKNNTKPPIVRRNPSAAKVSSRLSTNDAEEEGVEVSLTTSSATNQYTPRSNKSKQLFSPRPRGGKGSSSITRRGNSNGNRYKSNHKVGLEPEEFIISKPKATALPPRPTQQTAPPRTPNAPHTPGNSRGHKVIQPNSSDGASVNMSQLNLTQQQQQQQQQQDTLDNRNAHHMNNRPRTHSTEAFGPRTTSEDEEEEDIVGAGIGGSNPFDGDTIDGGGRYIGPPLKKKNKPQTLNSRSNSRGYWTEEIIDEEDDKGAAMDQYYGLNAATRNELYGHPPTSLDVEQGQSMMNPRTPGSNPRTPGNHMVNQATTTPGGTGVIDDYSFSNVNLSSPSGVGSPGGVVSPGKPQIGSPNSFLSSVFQVFASNDKNSGYAPPQYLNQHDNSQFNPNGINKKQGLLSKLTPPQKMGLGVLWMVVVCTIFGVTIGQLKKANQAIPLPNGSGSGASQANGMDGIQLAPPVKDFPTFSPTWEETPVPTPSPSDSPTLQPTTEEPTLNPITPSPIAGYHGIHGKANDGTIHPTRSPITAAPSNAPTTSSPSNSPSTSPTVDVEAAKRAWCAEPDATGEHLNHNDVLKTCAWLNIKPGLTDRKDKNCGGREVVDAINGGLIIYETTDLGDVCRQTCYLYNGCDQVAAEVVEVEEVVEEEVQLAPPVLVEEGLSNMAVMSDTTASTVSSECQDGSNPYGYKNHLDNFKTCEWLHNEKDGPTDRKDKNCGTKEYEMTQLGEACKYTCAAAEYITNSGCLLVDGNVVHVSSSMNGVQIMRSYSSPSYEFSVSSSANEEEESP